MQAELKDELDPDVRKRVQEEYKPKFADIERKRAQIDQDYNALRGRVGLPERAAEPTKPEQPKALPALPKGAKQIGTSGGKPVYETPDGKRFIAK
jgi:hypothetical protein